MRSVISRRVAASCARQEVAAGTRMMRSSSMAIQRSFFASNNSDQSERKPYYRNNGERRPARQNRQEQGEQRQQGQQHSGGKANEHYLPGTLATWDTSLPLWEHQDQVPNLPIPSIEDTLRRYEEYVTPLLKPWQLEKTREVIKEFVSSGNAEFLHGKVKELAQETPTGSYMEGFWNSMYLNLRCPQPINVTPSLTMGLDLPYNPPARGAGNQLERAAAVVFAVSEFAAKIRAGQLTQDIDKNGPLDSTQYTRFFSQARIPAAGRDYVRFAVPFKSRHVAIIRNNHIFTIDVLEDRDGQVKVMDEEQIFAALQKVVRLSSYGKNPTQLTNPRRNQHPRYNQDGTPNYHPNIAALTSLPREEWATIRKHMLEGNDDSNRRSLSSIEYALFVVCLDNYETATTAEVTVERVLAGQANRWWDKHMFVVDRAGTVSALLEHTSVDGHTAIRICDSIAKHLQETQTPPSIAKASKNHFRNIAANDSEAPAANDSEAPEVEAAEAQEEERAPRRMMPFVRELDFLVDDSVRKSINQAYRLMQDARKGLALQVLQFDAFGTDGIKNLRFAPDAFVQMAFQLAYYRLYSKFDSVYESTNVKYYRAGRTEVTRSVTNESRQFCEAFDTWAKEGKNEQIFWHLQRACSAHTNRSKEARQGLGVDRHLGCMKNIALQIRERQSEYNMPSLFTDTGFSRLTTSVLSTSNVSHPCFHLFAFGPVVGDGLGLAYNLHPNNIYVTVTSFQNESARFVEALKQAMLDMRDAVQQVPDEVRNHKN